MLSITKILIKKSLNNRTYAKFKNPLQKTLDSLRFSIRKDILKKEPYTVYPEHADIVIIGGGFLGSSAAYWLKTKAGEGLNVVVFDKNLNENISSVNGSQGILSHHYSLPENILLSQFTSEFLRNIKVNLNSHIDIRFQPHAYLVLASKNYSDVLETNVSVLKEYGIKHELLTTKQIQEKYPWINTSDVELGCLSTEGEGVFDSYALLRGLIEKSIELQANYINAEVVGFGKETQREMLMEGVKPMSLKKINSLQYKIGNNEEREIKFAICVLAAGIDSPSIAKLANLGDDSGLLSIPLPVERREFNVYSLGDDIPQSEMIKLNSPLVMDTSGMWLRRNGLKNNLICGQLPLHSDKKLSESEKYEMLFRPSLQHRFPDFSKMEVTKLGSEIYDCNTYDESGIIGPHPYHTNLILATGFGKLGIQHSPGLGRAIADLIIDGYYTDIDLTRMAFDRMLINQPIIETNVY